MISVWYCFQFTVPCAHIFSFDQAKEIINKEIFMYSIGRRLFSEREGCVEKVKECQLLISMKIFFLAAKTRQSVCCSHRLTPFAGGFYSNTKFGPSQLPWYFRTVCSVANVLCISTHLSLAKVSTLQDYRWWDTTFWSSVGHEVHLENLQTVQMPLTTLPQMHINTYEHVPPLLQGKNDGTV